MNHSLLSFIKEKVEHRESENLLLKEKVEHRESEIKRLNHLLLLLRRDKFGSKSELYKNSEPSRLFVLA